jgi:tetratricopeptide (TPR) repeat protein
MRAFWIFFCLAISVYLHGQTSPPIITVCGKSYEITGDFLTIIISENIKIKDTSAASRKAINAIEAQYETRLAALNYQYDETMLSLAQLEDSISQLDQQLYTAKEQARLLEQEFASIDFTTTSYLYQLAYYFFNQGKLQEATEIMEEHSLLRLEKIQAHKYILRAQALWDQQNQAGALEILKDATQKYSFYELHFLHGRLLLETGQPAEAAKALQAALDLAGSPGERMHCYTQLALSYSMPSQTDTAARYAHKALQLKDTFQLGASPLLIPAYLAVANGEDTPAIKIHYLIEALALPDSILGESKAKLQLKLGQVYLLAGQLPDGISTLKELLTTQTSNPSLSKEAGYYLAKAQQQSGQAALALESVQRALEQNIGGSLDIELRLLKIQLLSTLNASEAKREWKSLKQFLRKHDIQGFEQEMDLLKSSF